MDLFKKKENKNIREFPVLANYFIYKERNNLSYMSLKDIQNYMKVVKEALISDEGRKFLIIEAQYYLEIRQKQSKDNSSLTEQSKVLKLRDTSKL